MTSRAEPTSSHPGNNRTFVVLKSQRIRQYDFDPPRNNRTFVVLK